MPRKGAAGPAERQPVGQRPADFERLPKRFKDYIVGLEHQLYASGKLLQEQTDSPIWLEYYGKETTTRHLPGDARIMFQTTSGKLEVTLGRRRSAESLQVSSPDGRIVVLPDISNEVGIRVEKL